MTHAMARAIADDASLQAFVNCYLREVDSGTWQAAASWQASTGVRFTRAESHVVKLNLESQAQVLAFGVAFRSRVGRHRLTEVYRRKLFHREWQRIDALTAQLLLIDALYAAQPESDQRLELIARVIDSHKVMAEYVRQKLTMTRPRGRFIESEQAIVLGHWLHPTPKSRVGLHGWQHDHYTPELAGRFQLHFFAADERLVQHGSLLAVSAAAISRSLASAGPTSARYRRRAASLGEERCILPVHPLQAQWLLHQDYVRALLADDQLIDLGRLGPLFTATSSVRTLYAEDCDFMVKASIPVKITNSLRVNLHSELGDSVWMTQLLRKCGVAEALPAFRVIEDPAYLSLVVPGREETGFEVIFRSNPFKHARSEVHSIAALTEDPLTSGSSSLLAALVRAHAEAEQLSSNEASQRWFDAYWACAIEPPIRIYDGHGIALEAHQQNVLLELTASSLPRYGYYRDLQGVGLAECCRDRLLGLVPELAQQPKVFEPDDVVRNGLRYYLFFNQLYAVINRFALDGLLDEAVLLAVVRRKLRALRAELHGLGGALIDTLLEAKTLPCKANLRTRLADMDELESDNELAVYGLVENPLHVAHHEHAIEEGAASAET